MWAPTLKVRSSRCRYTAFASSNCPIIIAYQCVSPGERRPIAQSVWTSPSEVQFSEWESMKHKVDISHRSCGVEKMAVIYFHLPPRGRDTGNWTTRGYANSRIANSRTGLLADSANRSICCFNCMITLCRHNRTNRITSVVYV